MRLVSHASVCRLLVLALLLLAGLAGAQAAAPAATLIVLNKAGASASLLDARSGATLATLPTGDGPHELAISPDGRRAVISNYGQETPGRSLTLIDVAKPQVLRTIDLGDYRRPHGVAWIGDARVLVTVEANQAVLLVNVEQAKEVEAAVPTGQETSHMVVAAPDESRAWVTSIGSGTVTLIDVAERKLLQTLRTGEGAEGIDVSPDGKELWVANRGENTLSILDAQSLELRARIPSADFPIRVKFTPDGRHVLVTHARSGELRLFDAATRKPLRSLRFPVDATRARPTMLGERFGGAVPIGVVIAPNGQRTYVALAGTDEIAVVDLPALSIGAYWRAGREPDGLGLSPVRPN